MLKQVRIAINHLLLLLNYSERSETALRTYFFLLNRKFWLNMIAETGVMAWL